MTTIAYGSVCRTGNGERTDTAMERPTRAPTLETHVAEGV